MSLFSTILEKLGLHKKDAPAPTSGSMPGMAKPAAAPVAGPKPTNMTFVPAKPTAPASAPSPAPAPAPAAPEKDEAIERLAGAAREAPKPAAISEVDVVKKLEGLAAAKPMKLNWKTSISDLLFLLDMENSFEARKELATELSCPAELMHDSAKMNTWLHKEVLRQIAQNGGNIPKELLD